MMIINQLLFVCYFACCFFIPGWLLFKLLSFRRYVFLLSFSLSYSFLIAVLIALRVFQFSLSFFAPVIIAGTIVLWILWMTRLLWLKRFVNDRHPRSRQRFLKCRPSVLISSSIVLGLLWIYLWWAGPYLEIPADAWNHIWRFRDMQAQIDIGKFSGASSPSAIFLHQGEFWYPQYWYIIVAFLCQWSGLSIAGALTPLTIAALSFFCSGVFFTALALFRNFRATVIQKSVIATAAAIFCAASMGTNVFAYIRYYAFAPTMLNYILFLTAALVALDWLDAKKWRSHPVWIVPLFILTMNAVHTQEAIYVCFMIMGMALVNIARWLVLSRRDNGCLPVKSIITAVAALTVWFGLFFWLRHKNPIVWPEPNTIMPYMPIPKVSIPIIFKAWIISPPEHPIWRLFVYQAYMTYETIACWGLFVYLLFIIWFRQLSRSSYLVAGMAMPLLTVFNPVTIDLFVRLSTMQSPGVPPVALYRLNYILPLSFVAAFACVKAIEAIFQRQGTEKKHSRSRNLFAGITGLIIIAGLAGLLLPINNRWIYAPYSRIYTLAKRPGNDVYRWKDLIDSAAAFQDHIFITDPTTHRILSLLYPKQNYIGPLWMQADDPEKEFAESIRQNGDILTKGLVIINRRDGVPSVTGRISKHWPEDALQTSRHYSDKAIAFVESRTNRFKLLWAKDRIQVFQVIP